MQHVGAVAVQIEAKVRETGFKVDVDGCCWASAADTVATAVDVAVAETADHDLWVSTDPFLPTRSNRLVASSDDDDRPRSHWQLRQRRPQLKRRQRRSGDTLPSAHADGDGGGSNAGNNNTGNNIGMRSGRNTDTSHGVEVNDEEPNGDTFFRAETAGGGQCRSESRSLRRQRRLHRERGEPGRFQSAELDERTPFLGLGIDPRNKRNPMLHPSPGTLTVYRRCIWPVVLTAVPGRIDEKMLFNR